MYFCVIVDKSLRGCLPNYVGRDCSLPSGSEPTQSLQRAEISLYLFLSDNATHTVIILNKQIHNVFRHVTHVWRVQQQPVRLGSQ